jgi:preprotein translocase subunit SecG
MSFLIGLLTAVLFLTSILLVFLVLIQLPKKDAGAGVAFGAGATDALFGAGSGNALTRVTRHATIAFLGLSLVLSLLITRQKHPSGSGLDAGSVDRQAAQAVSTLPLGGQPTTLVTPEASNAAASTTTATSTAPVIPPPGTNK